MNNKVTLKTIADELGISIAAVSYGLKNNPRISQGMRTRIQKLARQYKYQVKSKVHAVIFPEKEMYFSDYSNAMLNSLLHEGKKRDCQMLLVPRDDMNLLDEKHISGAISFDFQKNMNIMFPRLKNIPLVCLNDPGRNIDGIYSVYSDEDSGIDTAVSHLVENGHHRIGFLYTEAKNISRRNYAFADAVEKHRLSSTAFTQAYSSETPFQEALQLLLLKKITALMVPGEHLEHTVRYYLTLAEKQIPDDISLITWENNKSRYFLPAPTTLQQNFTQIAFEAFEILEQLSQGKAVSDVKVAYIFNIRDTVKKLNT